ncbi:MAG: EF-hand domain-containing protein, partial [Promethearchaeia archaeon]
WAKFVREPGLCLPATAVKTPGTQPTAAGHASAGEATSAPAPPQVLSQTPADTESAAAASNNSAEWAAALSKDALSTALATPFSALDAKRLFTGDFASHFFRAQAAGGGKLDEAVREAFVKFDKDGSGEMDSQEFQAAIFSLGLELKAEEVEALFHAADSDSSGAIDVNEFAALVTRLLQAQELLPASEAGTDAEIAEAFRKFDEDDSG